MPNLTLEIVEGPDAPMSLLIEGSVQIGRDPALDITLSDDQVSRRHVRIRPLGDEAEVEDLASSNGTFINDCRMAGPTRLRVGDALTVGVSVLKLRSAAQVAAQPLVAPRVPPPLAVPARRPTYVDIPGAAVPAVSNVDPRLAALVDRRTKAQARLAPLAVSLLAVLVVLTYFATQ